VTTANPYVPAGYYPNGYRACYDAQAKEYRIARARARARRTGFTLSRISP
jgi:hypothetical protein